MPVTNPTASSSPTVGSIIASCTQPTNSLPTNDAAVSRTTYSALYAAIKDTFGAGDGSTTFNVPAVKGTLGLYKTATALSSARYSGTAVLMPNGSVILIGGIIGGVASTSVKRLDFVGNEIVYTDLTPLPATRYSHTATLLRDGRIALIGGMVAGNESNSVVFMTITGNTISYETASLPLPATRSNHTAVLLDDDRVFISCGMNGGVVISAVTTAIHSFLTISGTTTSYAAGNNNSNVSSRVDHTQTLLPNGTILHLGGSSSVGGAAATQAQSLTISGTTVSAISMTTMPLARSGHCALLLGDGSILIAGDSSSLVTHIADVRSGTVIVYTDIKNNLLAAKSAAQSCLLSNGSPFISGGVGLTENLVFPFVGNWITTGN